MSQGQQHSRKSPGGAIASVKAKRHLEGRGEEALEVELTEFRLWDRLAALKTIAQHLGMLVERHDLTSGGEKLPGVVVPLFGRRSRYEGAAEEPAEREPSRGHHPSEVVQVMVYVHVLNRGGLGVRSLVDVLEEAGARGRAGILPPQRGRR